MKHMAKNEKMVQNILNVIFVDQSQIFIAPRNF